MLLAEYEPASKTVFDAVLDKIDEGPRAALRQICPLATSLTTCRIPHGAKMPRNPEDARAIAKKITLRKLKHIQTSPENFTLKQRYSITK